MNINIKRWIWAVVGSIVAFYFVKLIWPEANSSYLIVFLILGYFINFLLSLRTKKAEVKQ